MTGSLTCKRESGSKYLKLWVEYSIEPIADTRSWQVDTTLYAQRTNTGYTTSGQGDFTLGINDVTTSYHYYYNYTNSKSKILSLSTVIDETSSGSGTCRISVVADGYSFYFTLDSEVALPIIDVTPPEVDVWLSNITETTAQLNVTANHPTYSIVSVEYSLDDVVLQTDEPMTSEYSGYITFNELTSDVHTAIVSVTSGNGKTVAIPIEFQTEFTPATEITAEPIAITVNETAQVTYVLAPAESTELVRYSIGNSEIASVDSLGYVTGHKVGETQLTLSTSEASASVTVTVTRSAFYRPEKRTYVRLFTSREKRFVSGGVCVLMPTVCTVSEKLNDSYTLTLEHPRDEWGKHNNIIRGAIIECPTPRGLDLFRIKKVDTNDPGKIVATAEHYTYDLNDNLVRSCKVKKVSGIAAAQKISSCLSYTGDIAVSSDIKDTASAEWDLINPTKALLGTEDTSFVNVYGGEAYRYRNTLTMRQRIGVDNAFIIRHRKNTQAVKLTMDDTDVVTRLIMSGRDSEGKVYMLSTPVDADNINDYPHPIIEYKDCSDIKVGAKDEDGKVIYKNKTAVQKALKEKGLSMFKEGISEPKCTLSVNIIAIEDTEEYNDYKALLLAGLGDSGRCTFRDGSAAILRMTGYSYNALTRRYTSVTLGDAKETIVDTINKLTKGGK